MPEKDKLGLGDRSLMLDSEVTHPELNGTKYFRFVGHKASPLFPSRRLKVGNLSLRHLLKEFDILWKLISDDGSFPPGDELATMHINLNYLGPTCRDRVTLL